MGMLRGLSTDYSYHNKNFTKNLNLPIVFLTLVAIFVIVFQPQLAAAVPTITLDQQSPSNYLPSDGGVGQFEQPTITVTDPAAAGAGTVNAHIKSTTDPVGVTLTLSENPAGSGTFTNTDFIFARDPTYIIPQSGTVTITIADSTLNTNPLLVETTNQVSVISTSDNTGIPNLVLTETGPNTGVFTAKLKFGSGPTSGNVLKANPGDVVSIEYITSGLLTNFMIAPNNHAGIGAIQAVSGDTITASYPGAVDAISTIGSDPVGGGGGGGLIRPGLVLDAVLSVISEKGGSPFIVTPPSFGGGFVHYTDGLTIVKPNEKYVFDISKYFQNINDQVLVTGQPVNMTFKMYDPYNINAIIHSGLYLITKSTDMITPNTIASIVYDKGSKLEINDPTKLFSKASVTPSSDGKFQYFSFNFTPTRSYEKMSFLARSWNDHRYSTDVIFHDAAVTKPKLDVLPTGFTKYDNFHDLITMLDDNGFEKPQIMAHIHSTSDIFSSDEGGYVYWLYDSTAHTVTLIISDMEGNTLYSVTDPLLDKEIQPKGDYGFMKFTTNQLNRDDVAGEQKIMKQEEAKAMVQELMTSGYHQENGVWLK